MLGEFQPTTDLLVELAVGKCPSVAAKHGAGCQRDPESPPPAPEGIINIPASHRSPSPCP